MTVLKIYDYLTDPKPLRRVAREVRPEELGTEEFHRFLIDLTETMRHHNGLGLAATQVDWAPSDGIPWRVFIMLAEGVQVAIINPRITAVRKKQWRHEACLSFRSVVATTYQPCEVEFECISEDGTPHIATVTEREAHVVAHETWHLRGKTLIDQMSHADRGRFLLKVGKARRT